jgi:hypothetical protein
MSPLANGDDESKSGLLARLAKSQKQQAKDVVADLLRMRRLMPLLMKNRNGGRWTDDEKSELIAQMRILSRLSPYLVFLLLPGSVVLLPIYARWVDGRRKPRVTVAVVKDR